MGFPELMEKLQTLPPEKQDEVFDFVEFLSMRYAKEIATKPASIPIPDEETKEVFTGPLADLRSQVVRKHGNVQPMSREELYDRPCLR